MTQQQQFDQQSAQITRLYQQRDSAKIRATRCVDELNWRLNPSGDVQAIEIEKVKQAVADLCTALDDLKHANEELVRVPFERRAQP